MTSLLKSSDLRWHLRTIVSVCMMVVSCTADVVGSCSKDCVCSGPDDSRRVDCNNMNLTAVPQDIEPSTLDLNLANNFLSSIPKSIFSDFSSLEILHLSSNRLREFHKETFRQMTGLKKLLLDGNDLVQVPIDALAPLRQLEALNLASNKLEEIPNYAFKTMNHLVILILHSNILEKIAPQAFDGLVSLKVLEINGNRLIELPIAISSLPLLEELTFADNEITFLDSHSFQSNKKLVLLELSGNPIHSTAAATFAQLPNLKKLTLSDARLLEHFPNLWGTSSLEHLRLDRARIADLPLNLCEMVPLLRSLNLKSNQLTKIPHFENCRQLKLVDLSYNMITSLDDESFLYNRNLIDLFLSHNQLKEIHENTFNGLVNLQVLDLESNLIKQIHPDAFNNFKELRDLNLGANRFSQLPTKGLQNVRELKLFNNRELKEFPPIENFPRVTTLALPYAYHCCLFSNMISEPKTTSPLEETIVWLTKDDISSFNLNISEMWLGYENFSSKFEEFAGDLWKHFGRDYAIPDNVPQYAEEYFEDSKPNYVNKYVIQCLPEPGPFMPCTDLFGWWSLRCGVWVVVLLALLGNGIVVIVLLVGRSKMDVPRFLVCNLAGSDFFMGIYLGMLAVVDASTLGEFKVSAIKWQTSLGCQIAGFLAVLSSELSVFTLSVITLERNYAITHAMHLNKRLSLRHAGYIMLAGYTFALIMATLPLFGYSDYRKFAICLPFETEDIFSLTYVVFLISINGVAFLILIGCYLKMYCEIRGSQAYNSNDSRIAKRMALLVVTDFLCWSPIAFFSLTAVCGAQLISLEEAKVFAIFVLPLNSCANPFLYAIFTKQFKKDCIHICKRIEESRVTRGIGRGRHSSNFSNLHAPIGANLGGIAAPFLASNSENSQDKIPNPEHEVCNCGVSWKPNEPSSKSWKHWALKYLFCRKSNNNKEGIPRNFTYAIGKVQRKNDRRHKHASSISSENFSSRSDSWRQVNIPMRLIHRETGKCSWKFHRKASQDSNASCSRQDSSTSTFRMSHSSFSSDASTQHKPWCPSHPAASVPSCERECHVAIGRDGKPKLCRQSAIEEAHSIRRCIKTSHPSVDSSENPRTLNERQNERLCTFCSKSNPAGFTIIYKSEDSDGKVECYHNKLAVTPCENNSIEAFPKEEEQHLLEKQVSVSNDCGILLCEKKANEPVGANIDLVGRMDPKIPREFDVSNFSEVRKTNSASTVHDTSYYNSCDPMVLRFQQNMEILAPEEKCRSLTNINDMRCSTTKNIQHSDSFSRTLPIDKTHPSSQQTLLKNSEYGRVGNITVKKLSLEDLSTKNTISSDENML